jgi:hypothetical protein
LKFTGLVTYLLVTDCFVFFRTQTALLWFLSYITLSVIWIELFSVFVVIDLVRYFPAFFLCSLYCLLKGVEIQRYKDIGYVYYEI